MWGEIAGATAGLIGGMGQAIGQKKAQKRQYQYNEQAANNAWKRQLGTMGLMRKWNSPAEKKRQLQEAGLSVGMMYGGNGSVSGGAQGTTAPQGGGVSMTQPVMGMAMQSGIQGMQAVSNMKLQEAQADNLRADTEKKRGVDTEAGWAAIEKMIADTGNVKAQTELTKVQTKIGEIEQYVADATKDNNININAEQYRKLVQETVLTQEQATQMGIDNKTREAMNEKSLEQIEAQTGLLLEKIVSEQAGQKLTAEQTKVAGATIKDMIFKQGLSGDQLKEQIRHNEMTEYIGWGNVGVQLVGEIGDIVSTALTRGLNKARQELLGKPKETTRTTTNYNAKGKKTGSTETRQRVK